MLLWAGRLEMSGRGRTSPRKSRCPAPAQWHQRASPARTPADPQRQERQWNSWFLFSCEWKSTRTRQVEGWRKEVWEKGAREKRGRKESKERRKDGREEKEKKVKCVMYPVRFSFPFCNMAGKTLRGPATPKFSRLLVYPKPSPALPCGHTGLIGVPCVWSDPHGPLYRVLTLPTISLTAPASLTGLSLAVLREPPRCALTDGVRLHSFPLLDWPSHASHWGHQSEVCFYALLHRTGLTHATLREEGST